MMETWAVFWGVVLLFATLSYLGLALTVTIGAYREALDMFRSIERQHQDRREDE